MILNKLISHFDMNFFPRVVWILSQITAFVLKIQQKNLRGQKSIVCMENCLSTSIFTDQNVVYYIQLFSTSLMVVSTELGYQYNCVKSARVRSYSGPHFSLIFPYPVRMGENAGKMRTRITPNTDSFYSVYVSSLTATACFIMLEKIKFYHDNHARNAFFSGVRIHSFFQKTVISQKIRQKFVKP